MKYNGSPGGKARAISSKKETQEKYDLNPTICKVCDGPISLDVSNQKASYIRQKKTCSPVCLKKLRSEYMRNRLRPTGPSLVKSCASCEQDFFLKDKKSQKYCSRSCAGQGLANLNDKTKKNIFEERKNWQSARSSIRRHASRAFTSTGRPYACHICGYSTKVEICHIKPVKDFPDDAILSEINSPDNLVALCANHHWEFDHNMLDKPLNTQG